MAKTNKTNIHIKVENIIDLEMPNNGSSMVLRKRTRSKIVKLSSLNREAPRVSKSKPVPLLPPYFFSEKAKKAKKAKKIARVSKAKKIGQGDQAKKKPLPLMPGSSPVQNFNAIKSTSGMPDSGPKAAEVTLDIRKIKDTEKFDVALDIIVDPDSSKPLNAKVYAQVDKDTMDVCGKAQSEADGFVRIEGQARGKNYEKKAMNLKTNIKNKSGESQKMCLRSGRKIKN